MASLQRSAIVIFDIDGVVRDVGGSYRRALADTVEHYTGGAYRPSPEDIDALKAEGIWNNDWDASQEMVQRHFESQGQARQPIDNAALVAFFQARYRGTNPVDWNGYICQEPLLMTAAYLAGLTQAGILWGFFSGATTASARYVLERRLGLQSPVLVAMEDAPGKPDPTGLFATVRQLEERRDAATLATTANLELPVIYVGDTVADMYTVGKARQLQPDRPWLAVGVLPPHVLDDGDRQRAYTETLQQAGAQVILTQVQELTPATIGQLLGTTARLQ